MRRRVTVEATENAIAKASPSFQAPGGADRSAGARAGCSRTLSFDRKALRLPEFALA